MSVFPIRLEGGNAKRGVRPKFCRSWRSRWIIIMTNWSMSLRKVIVLQQEYETISTLHYPKARLMLGWGNDGLFLVEESVDVCCNQIFSSMLQGIRFFAWCWPWPRSVTLLRISNSTGINWGNSQFIPLRLDGWTPYFFKKRELASSFGTCCKQLWFSKGQEYIHSLFSFSLLTE